MKMRFAFLALAIATFSSPVVHGGEVNEAYTEARVYLYGWEERTRTRLTLDRVRSSSKITVAILSLSKTRDFVRSIGLSDMSMRSDEVVDDEPRLVIDITTSDGECETFYASTTHLFSQDGRMWKKIDEDFKLRFTAVVSGVR